MGRPAWKRTSRFISHSLPFEFPDGVTTEAAAYGRRIRRTAIAGAKISATSNSSRSTAKDARDFDDAVWCERTSTGWKPHRCDTDEAHYVRPGTPLDQEARSAALRVFPNRVLPMSARKRCQTVLCSLVPQRDRLCLCCGCASATDGRSHARGFSRGHASAARLTYHEVGSFLEKPVRVIPSAWRSCAKDSRRCTRHLQIVHRAAQWTVAPSTRYARVEVKFDEQGPHRAIVEQMRNDAHRLIEECYDRRRTSLRRVPRRNPRADALPRARVAEIDRLETLRTFMREFGIWLLARRDHAEHLRDLLQKIGDRPTAA
jgi:ribonuclease R